MDIEKIRASKNMSKKLPKESNHDWTIFIAFGFLVLIAAANLIPIPKLWGINLFKYYPSFLIYLLIGLTAIFLIPGVARGARDILEKISGYRHGWFGADGGGWGLLWKKTPIILAPLLILVWHIWD